MSELEKIRAIIDGAADESMRMEIEETEHLLMNTFSGMLRDAHTALLDVRGAYVCFDNTYHAMPVHLMKSFERI